MLGYPTNVNVLIIKENIRWLPPEKLSSGSKEVKFKEIVKNGFDSRFDVSDVIEDGNRIVINLGGNYCIVAQKLHGKIIFLDPSRSKILSDPELTMYLKNVTEIRIGRYASDYSRYEDGTMR